MKSPFYIYSSSEKRIIKAPPVLEALFYSLYQRICLQAKYQVLNNFQAVRCDLFFIMESSKYDGS